MLKVNNLSQNILRIVILALVCMLILPATSSPASALSGSDFNAGRIVDDHIFFDSNTMAAPDIQAFLNSKMPVCDTNHPPSGDNQPPFICLKDYQQSIPHMPADQYCGGAVGAGTKSAAQIIKDVSVACSVSPKVLIVLLQKEQSLVTDTWPWNYQYKFATGFCVFDTGPPPPSCDGTDGFFNQVYYAARQFQRYSKQPNSFGYRSQQSNYIQYHPNASCGGTNVFIQNQATAGLYNYTPYQPNASALANLYGSGDGCGAYGNRNFWRLYNDWFGSPVSSHCIVGTAGPIITGVAFRKLQPRIDSGNFIIYSGSGTNCIESHTWGVGFRAWQNNTASNHPIVNPANANVQYADLSGDGRDEPILVATNNTGSGMVEFHVWDYTLKNWIVHAISNLPTSAAPDLAITFGDLNGDGKDDPVAIGYKNTGSGKIEFHTWNSGVQTWQNHIISNLGAPINPAEMQIKFGDLNGDNTDEAIAIGVDNTSTGKIEFHVWAAGQWAWQSHIVSNHSEIDVAKESVDFADFDGDRIDNGVVTGTAGTSTGKIEFHVWNPGLTSWQGHYVSNQQIL